MNYWLVKTDPHVFSFDDLVKAPKKTTFWEGVRNYQARNFMRDGMKKGDSVLVYHSNIDDPSIVGIARVVRESYADASAWDPKSDYFDERAAAKGTNPWVRVDIQATHRFEKPITRSSLKDRAPLKKMKLLVPRQRLSVQPVTEKEYQYITSMSAVKKV